MTAVHLLQVGWKGDNGAGDWWGVPGASIVVEAGATYAQEFSVGTPPKTLVGTAVLGDHTMIEGDRPFEVESFGLSTSGDELQLRSEA